MVGDFDGLGGGVGSAVGLCELFDGLGFGVGEVLLVPDGDGVVDGLPLGEAEALADGESLGLGQADGAVEA